MRSSAKRPQSALQKSGFVKPPTIQEVDNESKLTQIAKEVPMKDLADTKTQLKQHQQELFIKQLEFDVIKNMDIEKINEMLLNQNLTYYDVAQKAYEHDKVDLKIPECNPNQLLDRKARKEDYAKSYLLNKRDIYQKIKPVELKALTQVYEQKRRTMSSAQVENKDKLYQEYQEIYMDFLQRQPMVEYGRRQLIQDLSQCHEMLSALGNTPTFEKPALWKKSPLSIQDSQFVQNYCKEKASEFSSKYNFKQEDFDFLNDKTDIYFEVKKYLDSQYFSKNV